MDPDLVQSLVNRLRGDSRVKRCRSALRCPDCMGVNSVVEPDRGPRMTKAPWFVHSMRLHRMLPV